MDTGIPGLGTDSLFGTCTISISVSIKPVPIMVGLDALGCDRLLRYGQQALLGYRIVHVYIVLL